MALWQNNRRHRNASYGRPMQLSVGMVHAIMLVALLMLGVPAYAVESRVILDDREITIISLHPEGRTADRAMEIDQAISITQLNRPCPRQDNLSLTPDEVASQRSTIITQRFKCLNEQAPFVLTDAAFNDDHRRRYLAVGLLDTQPALMRVLRADIAAARISHLGAGAFTIEAFALDGFTSRFVALFPQIMTTVTIFISLAVAMLATGGSHAPSIIGPFLLGLSIALIFASPLASNRLDAIFLVIGLLIMARAAYDILTRSQRWSPYLAVLALVLVLLSLPAALGHGMFMLALLAGLALFFICIAFQSYLGHEFNHTSFVLMLGLMNGLWLAQSRYHDPLPEGAAIAMVSGEILAASIACIAIIVLLRIGHSLFDVLQPARTNIYRDGVASLFVAFGSFMVISHLMRLL